MNTKNLLFSCCILDPWLEVAKSLADDGHNIKYWIGWKHENLNEVSSSFPDATVQTIQDAWRGNFNNFDKGLAVCELDGDMLKSIAFEELMAIKMMERLDWNQQSFTFNERQSFFRLLLRSYLYILKRDNIDLIISPSIPHRVFDYALYVAAKILNIQFLTFKMTTWLGRLIPTMSITEIPLNDHLNIEGAESAVKKYIEKVSGDYTKAEPYYMIDQRKKGVLSKIKEKFKKGGVLESTLWLFKQSETYTKNVNDDIHKNSNYNFQEVYIKRKGISFKKKLYNYYESLCVSNINLREKYIFVALHYQPEETSCPSGGIYVNQDLMIETLLKNTPNDVLVYVKEHSSQFNSLMEGETGRNAEFYNRIKKNKRVRLISTNTTSFQLIDNAIAVATLTGTVGLEAIVRDKPVLVFGNAWYKSLSGVVLFEEKVPNNFYEKILKEKVEKESVTKGLVKIYNSTIQAYVYAGYKERSNTAKEVAVNNLLDVIRELL